MGCDIPYWKYLSGETHFQWNFPASSSDLTHFRERIGKKVAARQLKLSINLSKPKIQKKKWSLVLRSRKKLYSKIKSRANYLENQATRTVSKVSKTLIHSTTPRITTTKNLTLCIRLPYAQYGTLHHRQSCLGASKFSQCFNCLD